jgi:hypothetical protein
MDMGYGEADPVGAAATQYGLDPSTLRAFIHIESGGDPRAQTGSYKGLLQLGPDEWSRYGSGDIWNPTDNLNAGAAKLKAESASFAAKYGRAPTPADLYMVHQQGAGGYDAHMAAPDAPAWQNMASTAEGQQKGARWAKRAIWGNVPDDMKPQFGSVDNVTSKAFTDLWAQKVARLGGAPAPAPASDAPRGVTTLTMRPDGTFTNEAPVTVPPLPVKAPGMLATIAQALTGTPEATTLSPDVSTAVRPTTPIGIQGIAQTLAAPVRKVLGMSDDYSSAPMSSAGAAPSALAAPGFRGSSKLAQILLAKALENTPANQVGPGAIIGKLAMMLAGGNMMQSSQSALANALAPSAGQPGAADAAQAPTTPSAPTMPAMSTPALPTATGGVAPLGAPGSFEASPPSPEPAAPVTPAPPPAPVQPSPATPSDRSFSGGGGAPSFIPPTPGASQALPSVQQVHALLSSEDTRDIGLQYNQMRMEAMKPTTFNTPDGHTYVGNNYTGWHLSGLPAKPTIEKFQTKVGDLSFEQPKQLRYDASGQPIYQDIPTTGGGASPGAPGSGSGAEMPGSGATPQALKAWSDQNSVRMAEQRSYAEEAGKTYGKKQADIEGIASKAQVELSQLQILKQVLQDPAFRSGEGGDIMAKISSAARNLGLGTGQRASLQEFAKKLGAAGSLENIQEMAQAGTVRVPEMHMIEKSNFSVENTPEANAAVVEVRLRTAQRQMDIARMAQDYADQNGGRIDRHFDKLVRANYADKPLFSDAEVSHYSDLLAGSGSRSRPATHREGDTATGPGGKRAVFKGGKWVVQ